MLQYLSGDSLPDLKLDTNQVTRHTHNPKLLHDNIIKLIYQYIMGNIYKGLALKPNKILNVDFYVEKTLQACGMLRTLRNTLLSSHVPYISLL